MIQAQLNDDLKQAMLARDQRRVDVLRFIKSALQSEQVNLRRDLTEDEAMKVLQRELKKRQEAADLYEQSNDAERSASEREEAEILQSYLPEQLSEAELNELIDKTIATVGEGAHMGAVIQGVLQAAAGRADGATVSRLVKERLG